MNRPKYEKPIVFIVINDELGKAFYGAMASSCCKRTDRCG